MVDREEFDCGQDVQAKVRGARRNPDGSWTIAFELEDFVVQLPDGRTVHPSRRYGLVVKGYQTGRKRRKS